VRKKKQTPTNNFDTLEKITANKSKLVAWIVSHCGANSQRDILVKEIQKFITVDIFGLCGELKCGEICDKMLEEQYKFYIAFENSLCE